MPADDSPAILVARFLRGQNYVETLAAFIAESGLPPDAGTMSRSSFTIEKLLDEKREFDISTQFERLNSDDSDVNTGWSTYSPTLPTAVSTLPSASNILHTSFETLTVAGREAPTAVLLATTADRRLNVVNIPTLALDVSTPSIQDSPILSCATLHTRHLLAASMSGQLILARDIDTVVDQRRDHAKYIIKIATHRTKDPRPQVWIATAGWDAKICLYQLPAEEADLTLPEPISTIVLPSNPEAIQFLTHPDSKEPILIVTRRDSSFLYYYTVSADARLLGRQNLAPHSNSWVSFTPSAIDLCPTNPSILAIATSAVPHMKLIVVRLLIPPMDAIASEDLVETRSGVARAELALQEREVAAIQLHCSTLAPQTPYSTPALVWRPDGTGVWVNSDDGAIRGFEARSGKHIATLKAHTPGSKVRCLASAFVEVDGKREEWLASGGFDQQLIVWKPDASAAT